MTQVLTKPLLGLDCEFPDALYLLFQPTSQKYGCYCHGGVHGLACFSSESAAFRFAELIDLNGMIAQKTSFDEAREIAKERPMPVNALMLLDSITNPVIHFVR